MAININTRTFQQKAPSAQAFGYNEDYKSAAPAIADALGKVGQAAASIQQTKIRKQEQERVLAERERARQRQNEADQRRLAAEAKAARKEADDLAKVRNDLIGGQAISNYTTGFTAAQGNLARAKLSNNPESVAQAEKAIEKYNPYNKNFTFNAFTGDPKSTVDDLNYYASDENKVREEWTTWKQKSMTAEYKADIQLIDTLSITNVEASLNSALGQHLNQTLPNDTFNGIIDEVIFLAENPAKNSFTTDEKREQRANKISNIALLAFNNQIDNNNSTADLELKFAQYRTARATSLSNVVNEADDKAIAKAFTDRIEFLNGEGKKQVVADAKRTVTEALVTANNQLNQGRMNIYTALESINAAAQIPANVLALLDDDDASLKDYNEIVTLNEFFSPTGSGTVLKLGTRTGQSPILNTITDALLRARDSNLPIDIQLPKEYQRATAENTQKLRDFSNGIATRIQKGLAMGDTSVLDLIIQPYEVDDPIAVQEADAQKRVLLKQFGYQDMALFNGSGIGFNPVDAAQSEDYFNNLLSKNTRAGLLSRAFTLTYGVKSNAADVQEGIVMEIVASNSDRVQEVTQTYANLSVQAQRFDDDNLAHARLRNIMTGQTTMLFGANTMGNDSELINKRDAAIRDNRPDEAEFYNEMLQGIAVQLAETYPEESDNFLRDRFFELEETMLLNSVGIERRSSDDRAVFMFPSLFENTPSGDKKFINTNARTSFPVADWYIRPLVYNKASQYALSAITEVFGGTHTMLPVAATNRIVEAMADEVASNYGSQLEFGNNLLRTLGPEYSKLVEKFEDNLPQTDEEISDFFLEARVDGKPAFNFNKKVVNGNNYAVAVTVRNNRGFYEPLIVDGEAVVITEQGLTRRLDTEGMYPTIGVIPNVPETIEAITQVGPTLDLLKKAEEAEEESKQAAEQL